MNSHTFNPFTRDELNRIFAVSPKHPDRLISRENNRLEFKEAFGLPTTCLTSGNSLPGACLMGRFLVRLSLNG